MYCKQLSLLFLKFSDVRQLYAVYIHFISQVFREFINRPGFGKTYFFIEFFGQKILKFLFFVIVDLPSGPLKPQAWLIKKEFEI